MQQKRFSVLQCPIDLLVFTQINPHRLVLNYPYHLAPHHAQDRCRYLNRFPYLKMRLGSLLVPLHRR